MYNEKGELILNVRKPTFEVYLLYYPVQGILRIKAGGGKKKAETLKFIFIETALDILPKTNDKVFELNCFKTNENLSFPTDPADLIESVQVKLLRLSWPGQGKRIIVEAENTEQLYSTLKSLKLPLKKLNVTQVVLKAKFPGKGRSGSVTFRLTWPDSCDLGESKKHQKLRMYLKRWGIENVQ